MSDTPSQAPINYIMPKWITGPQDFVGGLALMGVALFALWASSDLQGMHGFSFGAGTAPRMFAGLLLRARLWRDDHGPRQRGLAYRADITGAARSSCRSQSSPLRSRSARWVSCSRPLPAL